MNFKTLAARVLALTMMLSALSALTACSSNPPASQGTDTTQTSSVAEGFVLKYPQDMQDLGFTEDLHLDKTPSRIACVSTYPVMTLYELGVNMVAVPATNVITYPDDLKAEQFPNLMSDQFDLERIVATQPDLIIMPTSARETHGATLTDLGIPVYYISIAAQKDVSIYEIIKNQTQVLIDAFATDNTAKEAGKALMQRFTDLETKLEDVKSQYADKQVLVLMSADPTSHFIQGENGVLGSMLSLMGFQNVYHPASGASMGNGHNSAPLDMETTLNYKPDLVVFTGSGSQADIETLITKTIAQNPSYWNSISAIQAGSYICLPGGYVSTAGINIIENINNLIDILNTHYAN